MARRPGQIYCAISSCDIVLWTELITKKDFWVKTTYRVSLNWVLSLNLKTMTRILMLCTILAVLFCNLVVLSTTLHHQVNFGHAVQRPLLREKPHNFQVSENHHFFQTQFKLWNSVFKYWTFKTLKNWFRFICTLKVPSISFPAQS